MTDGPFRPHDVPEGRPPAGGAVPDAPGGPSPGPPRPATRFSSVTWILGVAVVLILAYITLNTIRTDAPGSRGPEVGGKLPPFAAPLAIGGPDADAQVDPEKACGVRGRGILNVCELGEKGPLVLAFLATKGEQCAAEVDRLDRLREASPEVQFAAVAIRGERAELKALIRRRGWELPVAWDRDGAISNVYGVAICPTVAFARRGGVIESTALGAVSEAELARRVAALR